MFTIRKSVCINRQTQHVSHNLPNLGLIFFTNLQVLKWFCRWQWLSSWCSSSISCKAQLKRRPCELLFSKMTHNLFSIQVSLIEVPSFVSFMLCRIILIFIVNFSRIINFAKNTFFNIGDVFGCMATIKVNFLRFLWMCMQNSWSTAPTTFEISGHGDSVWLYCSGWNVIRRHQHI